VASACGSLEIISSNFDGSDSRTCLFLLIQLVPQLGKIAGETYTQLYGKPKLTTWLMAVAQMSLATIFSIGYWKMKRWAVLLNGFTLLIGIPYNLVTHPPEDVIAYLFIDLVPLMVGLRY
jgi:hypothetical protein